MCPALCWTYFKWRATPNKHHIFDAPLEFLLRMPFSPERDHVIYWKPFSAPLMAARGGRCLFGSWLQRSERNCAGEIRLEAACNPATNHKASKQTIIANNIIILQEIWFLVCSKITTISLKMANDDVRGLYQLPVCCLYLYIVWA